MTVDINTLKKQTNNGEILYGDVLASIIDRSVHNPDSVYYNAQIDKNSDIQLFKDNGGYDSVNVSNDSTTDIIDNSKILSSKYDYSKDSDGNDIYTFYTYTGENAGTIIINNINTQSGINKDLVISSIVKADESNDYINYNVLTYNGQVINTIKVYKAPKITHLESKEVLSSIAEDTSSDKINKYNVLKYDQSVAMTIESNKVPAGLMGQYGKIKDVLGSDVNISGLSTENFDPANIYIPKTFEYGKSTSDYRDYVGYYIPESSDKDSSNLVLMILSEKDNDVQIYDVAGSYNVGYLQLKRMSNFSYVKSFNGKDYKYLFAIRPNEINPAGGGFYYFDFIFNNEPDGFNSQGQIFPAGKNVIGTLNRKDIDDFKNNFNVFKLFDLNYEPYKSRKMTSGNKFIGHEIVMMKDKTDEENIKEIPVHLIATIELTTDGKDASKDVITISTEVYNIFSTDKTDTTNYVLDDKGVVLEMNRYLT